jgi:hydrogenase nickel incorporation protein HypB
MKKEAITHRLEECIECRGTGKIAAGNCTKCNATGQIIIHSHEHRHGDSVHDHPHPHQDPHQPGDDTPHDHTH